MSMNMSFHSPGTQAEYLAALQTSRFGAVPAKGRRRRRSNSRAARRSERA